MGCIGNVLWLFLGGLPLGLGWLISGCLWCVTIVGIPVGLQCFKIAGLAFWPVGRQVVYPTSGAVNVVLNVVWILLTGWILALEALLCGCLLCITIIGIPFGKQCFKLAKLAFMPFGTIVV